MKHSRYPGGMVPGTSIPLFNEANRRYIEQHNVEYLADQEDAPGLCTVHNIQCEADGSGAVTCPECMKTEEGRARL